VELRQSRLAGDVYALPWLLVIGEPQVGKSCALQVSGLEIPAVYGRTRAPDPTPHLEWWFTNQAVVLDTAGRYLASEDPADDKEWQRLLRLIRQSRSQLPLNGIVLAVSANALLAGDGAALDGLAHRLRRRLNEIVDELGIDPPIYLLVTGADQIEGFTDFAAALPPANASEAFGFTNTERRFPDAGDLVTRGIDAVRTRLDGFLAHLLMREPDPERRRRIFLLPQEIEEVGRSLASLARRAFNPTIYGETPFLRGVYFTSALRQGLSTSSVMRRLGYDWQGERQQDGSPRPLFLRDVFRDIIVGDHELAVEAHRIGPRSRRFVLGTALAVAGVLAAVWAFAGFSIYRTIDRLRAQAEPVATASPTLAGLDDLRAEIERASEQRSFFRRAGLGGASDIALERARAGFVSSFGHSYEGPTKTKLLAAARLLDEAGFQAVAELARDVAWLGARAGLPPEQRPRLAPLSPAGKTQADAAAFTEGYDAWIRWSDEGTLHKQLDRERDVLAQAALQWMDLQRVEAWTQSHQLFAPARYADVGVPAPAEGVADSVSGAYTRPAWDALIRILVAGLGAGVSDRATIDQFRRAYTSRFDDNWRRYLLDAPTPAQADERVRSSPYIALVQQIEDNASIDIPRDGASPPWLALLSEARRETPRDGEQGPPPWSRYLVALDQVAADVSAAQARSDDAFDFALRAARGEPTSFGNALAVVRELVPDKGDPQAAAKLRELLSMPILNGFTLVLDRALVKVDASWQSRVASVYGGALDQTQLQQLYAPREGALAKFESEVLGPFLSDGQPKRLLADRALPFGPHFVGWLGGAGGLQRALYPALGGAPKISVRLEGIPSKVSGPPVFVSRRDLNLACPNGLDSFVYREGTGGHTFQWTPDCNELSLRVWVRQPDGGERELLPRHEWSGPLALPQFLQAGRPSGAGNLQWALGYPQEGIEVAAVYQMRSGKEALALVHQPPPQSTRE